MGHFFNYNSETIRNLGIKPEEHAFNAGVFVCDLDEWRNHRVTGVQILPCANLRKGHSGCAFRQVSHLPCHARRERSPPASTCEHAFRGQCSHLRLDPKP